MAILFLNKRRRLFKHLIEWVMYLHDHEIGKLFRLNMTLHQHYRDRLRRAIPCWWQDTSFRTISMWLEKDFLFQYLTEIRTPHNFGRWTWRFINVVLKFTTVHQSCRCCCILSRSISLMWNVMNVVYQIAYQVGRTWCFPLIIAKIFIQIVRLIIHTFVFSWSYSWYQN